jgi:tetratricopeptide (TPR) repeat protein
VLVVAGSGVASAQTAQDSYYQFLMARHFESEGDTSAALAALERAAAADPTSAEIHAEIASLQYRRNQRSEAEKAARTALGLDSTNFEANRILGFLYVAEAQNERATPAERAGYVRSAITHLERAAAAQRTDLNLSINLGRLYLTVGDMGKAVETLTQAVSQSPFSIEARRVLALAHASVQDYRAAIATLEEIAEDEPRVLASIGEFQYEAGLYVQAAETLTRALAVQPNSLEIKEKRIIAAYQAGDYPRAASFAADAQRQHSDEPRFPILQAQALSKSGSAGRAIALLESTVKAFPRDTGSRYALADLYNDSGRSADAERLLRQILAGNPSDPNALNHLGYLLAQNGRDLDEAILLVNRALQVRPNEGAYLDSLGWAYFQRGDLAEADQYLGQAIERMPDNSEVLDHVGDLRAAQGRWQDAIAAWSRALDGNGSGVESAVIRKKIDDARGRLAR